MIIGKGFLLTLMTEIYCNDDGWGNNYDTTIRITKPKEKI